MGTPDFARPVLAALIGAGHEIARVYTQPPRPAGRGNAMRKSPVHEAAETLGLPVETPGSFRSEAVLSGFQTLHPDAAIVVAYGQILPRRALDVPRLGCLNLHASLLPRWRGAAPIQRAIMAGDDETGVSVMQMDAGLDTGPVLSELRTRIGDMETAGNLHDRLAELGAPLMVETLAALSRGDTTARPQPDHGATYAAKIQKAEARIDWSRPSAELDCHIRGLSPFPGAWSQFGNTRVKVLTCRREPAASTGEVAPGTALDDRLLIRCGEGALRLIRLQRAGRTAGDAEHFLNGFPVPMGTELA